MFWTGSPIECARQSIRFNREFTLDWCRVTLELHGKACKDRSGIRRTLAGCTDSCGCQSSWKVGPVDAVARC